MSKTTIEWTRGEDGSAGYTWNPVTGCTKISAGCKNCYAERLAFRLQAMGQPNYANGFRITLQDHMLDVPRKWKKSRTIFVNSMSDLFHVKVPTPYIQTVFDVMNDVSWHRYQVLTKRAERLLELNEELNWGHHIWMGVSVENSAVRSRIDYLRKTKAHTKFLSLEPLIGALPGLDLSGIDWVIVGGESGHGARPIKEEWVTDIRDQCLQAGVAFFFKQWGGVNKKRTGRLLQGRTWDEMPRLTK